VRSNETGSQVSPWLKSGCASMKINDWCAVRPTKSGEMPVAPRALGKTQIWRF